MKMKSFYHVAIFIMIIVQIGFSQNFDKNKLDQYFDALDTHNKFMGSVAILQNDNIVYSRSSGYCDYGNRVKTNVGSKYRIGSISKTFTAVLILKAIEEQRMTLDQTLIEFYPNINNAYMITIEQLLYQRTGIHSFTDDDDYNSWKTEFKSEKELIDIISKGKIEFEPDSIFSYSNPNYILLAFILQQVYGKAYADILKEKITQPLQLRNTFYGGKINPDKNECHSYTYTGGWEKETETDMSIPTGAGAIVSTPSDLVNFGNALMKGKIISKESLDKMTTIRDGYGMGIFELPFYENTSFGHTGGIDGFSSILSCFAESGVVISVLSNGSNYSINSIALALLSEVFNKPYDIPEFSTYQTTPEELDKYLGVYSTTQMPLKLTITKEGNTLIAQATNQPQLRLEAIEKDSFSFDRAGLILKFDPESKTLLLTQGGGELIFTKE